jgi:hypothetical protein
LKWRVDIDQIDTAVRQLAELIEIIAAVNDARIDERRGLSRCGGHKATVIDVSTSLNMTGGSK